jgi:hypothetical protein
MRGIGQFLKYWLLEYLCLRGVSGCGSCGHQTGEWGGGREEKEGEVEVPHLLARPSNVFDQKCTFHLLLVLTTFVLLELRVVIPV